ncbi:hypothetical protein ACFLXL_03465 [Chloroflexota bacterium]
MSKMFGLIGFIAFIIGVVIAVIAGIIAPDNAAVIIILVILGIIIGVLNISSKETVPLLLAVIALIVVGGVFAPIKVLGIGALLDQILRLFAVLMAPAAVIVAVKALWNVGFPKD